MTAKILFVDDEPRILQGVRRILHRKRNQWQLFFATSVKDAIALLIEHQITIAVVDMRMPPTGGDELLSHIAKHYPSCVRIVLYGQSNRDTVLKVVSSAHQFLAKPCESEQLISTLTRATELSLLISQPELKTMLAGIGDLPSMPDTYQRLKQLTQQQDYSLQQVAVLISQDPTISLKILKLVNSAFFGLPRTLVKVEEAVQILGTDKIASLVFMTELFSCFTPDTIKLLKLQQVFDRSLQRMSYSKAICKIQNLDRQTSNLVEACCLLSDIGQIALATSMPERYLEIITLSESQQITLAEAEKRQLGTTHMHMTAYLLGVWGLPLAMTELLLTQLSSLQLPLDPNDPAVIISASDYLAHIDCDAFSEDDFATKGFPMQWADALITEDQ